MSPERIEIVERPDIDPICPHCGGEIRSIWTKQINATLGKRYIYFCSHCMKVLGVTQRKGFWMG